MKTAVLIPAVLLSRVRLLYYAFAEPCISMVLSTFLNIFGNYLGLLIPVWLYNGEKGDTGRRFQLFMYAFYPAHLLLRAAIGYLRPPF